mgnify:CR=1 FL=1
MTDPLGLLNNPVTVDPLGLIPEENQSEFKGESNPRMIVDGVDTRTGKRINPEVFSDWWADFLKNDPANREKIFYSLVTAQDTGLPPSIIYDNTDKPPANWMRQNEVTLTKTIREILEIPKSLGEVGLTFVSGAVGWGVSSILGIAEATKPGASRESIRAVMEDAGRRIGYEPQTRPAREFLGRAGRLIQAAIAPAGEAAALVGESWDSPFLEAVLRFAGEAAIFNLIGKGAEKIQKPPDWYYRLTVRERGVVEGIKTDIVSGELTNEQVRYLWRDPANRAAILELYQRVETAPEVAGEVTKQAPGETLPAGEIVQPGAGKTDMVETGKITPVTEAGLYRARGLDDAIEMRREEPGGSLANYDVQSTREWLRGQTPPADGNLTLYRATPTGEEIKPGDYVTNSLQYAKDHIKANLGKGKIAKIEATLDDIYPADGPGEFWYAPKSIETTPKAGGQITEAASDDINLLLDMAARTDQAAGPAPTTEYDKIRVEAARIAYEKTSKKIDLKKRREARALERQGMEEARQDPVFLAMDYAVKQGGLNRDKLLHIWDKETVNELAKKRIGLVTKEGKLGLDEIAEDHGFVSDDALMSMMLDWKGLGEVGKKAAAEFEERYSELMSEAEKEDFHLSLLEEEAKILRGMIKATGKPSTPGIKKAIREQTGQIRVDELMVSEYEALKAGMKKAEQASRKAFREGKLDGALFEKERQIEMAQSRREKLKAKEEAKKIHDGIVKLTKDKSIPEEYQDRIADLLEGFDLLPRSDRSARRVESAREFLERQKAAGEDVSIPESMLARIERYGRTHWRELTLDQLREIFDQAQMYTHLGKIKNKLIQAKEKRDFEDVVATIVTEIGKNWGVKPVSPEQMETIFMEKTFGEKLGDFKESYLASLTKVETYLRRLDGFKDLGPIHELIYMPVKRSSDVEYRRLVEITKELRELFDPVKKSLTKEKFRVPGVDQFLTRETVVMTAMNSGNEGNLDALRENRVYNWDDAKIQTILGKVTPEEWLLYRGVIDMFEYQWPELARVSKNMSGITLRKVEGDYFPLVFDRRLSWIADRNATEKELRDFFQSIYTLPSVKTGSTIERLGGKLPPKLKFTVIFDKLAEINHYITHAEAVRDVQKILADPRVRAAIEGAPNGIGGPEAYREMMTWLQDVARQQADPMSAVEAVVKTVRINTSVVAMGWKFSTAVVQFLGWGNTIYKTGLVESTKGLAEFYTNREAMVEKIKGMSPELSGRAKVFDRELRDAYNRIGLDQFRGSQVMKDSFFSLIATMDMAVAYPTWVAAYNKGMKDFAGEASKAIEFADMTVRMTQGTALVKDLAGIQRGAEMKKILSLFYTFFSAYHQMMADAWLKFKFDKTGQNFGDLMRAWWWLTILPATIDYMIKEREVPSPGEFVKNVLQMRLTAYPVVRDITGAVLTDYDYQFSPVSRAGEVVGRFAKEISKAVTPEEEVDYDKLLRYGLESSGYIYGLPTGQAVVTMQGLIDLLNGETSDPTRLLFRAPREENE